jgi:branched-chain amino acid transport system permease protein
MVNLVNLTGGEGGMIGIPRPQIFDSVIKSKAEYLVYIILITAICFFFAQRLTTSPFGRVLKAIRDDEEAVRAIGKNVLYFKVAIFMVAGAVAGIAGNLFAHYTTFINPSSFVFTESIFIIAIVIFGGTGNLLGSVVGAVILVSVPELMRFIRGFSEAVTGPLRNILYGAMLVIMIRFRPQGILPEYSNYQADVNSVNSEKESGYKPVDPSSSSKPFPHLKFMGEIQEQISKSKEVIFSAEGLIKHFGGVRAVHNLTINIEKGEIIGLIGPNGAGKTTFFNLVTGAILPETGVVKYKGKDITGLPPYKCVRLGFSRTFQDLRLFPRMTVFETLMVARPKQKGENIFLVFTNLSRQEKANRDYAMELLKFVGLIHKSNVLVQDLSYPEQKLLSLARLLATAADLLLLDEPTSGLDYDSIKNILGLIKLLPHFGKTICIVEHNLDVIRDVSDRVYFLAEGHVLKEGTPDEIFTDSKLAEIYFGGGLEFWDSR